MVRDLLTEHTQVQLRDDCVRHVLDGPLLPDQDQGLGPLPGQVHGGVGGEERGGAVIRC